jgi:2-polyprenyl-6-methoxyphenol hydroxylase-like FAD-dependent oxidoreductase
MPDLVVVGGGPVGLAASLYAARSGLSVTVLEPRTGLVDKACGEGLMPGAVKALASLGVDAPGFELQGIRYVSGARHAVADFSGGAGRGVRRTTLHHGLSEAVQSAGVEVVVGTATEVEQDGDWVRVGTRDAAGRRGAMLTSRHVLAADGLHSPLRRALGLERPTRAEPGPTAMARGMAPNSAASVVMRMGRKRARHAS